MYAIVEMIGLDLASADLRNLAGNASCLRIERSPMCAQVDVGGRVQRFSCSGLAPPLLWCGILRTTIGVVGAPKRDITLSIQCAVVLLIQPRCWPQSAQISSPAWGLLPGPIVQTLRQQGRSRSIGRSIFTRSPASGISGSATKKLSWRFIAAPVRAKEPIHATAAKRGDRRCSCAGTGRRMHRAIFPA